MNIEKGWRFNSADFSAHANNPRALGCVALVRSPTDKARWHKQPDEMKDDDDCPPLYVYGCGMTLEEAITNANLAAAHAKPIVEGE